MSLPFCSDFTLHLFQIINMMWSFPSVLTFWNGEAFWEHYRKLAWADWRSPNHLDQDDGRLGSSKAMQSTGALHLNCYEFSWYTFTLSWLKVSCRRNMFLICLRAKGTLRGKAHSGIHAERSVKKSKWRGKIKLGDSCQDSSTLCVEYHTHTKGMPSWRVHLAWLSHRFIISWGNVRREEGKGCASLKTQRRKTVLAD